MDESQRSATGRSSILRRIPGIPQYPQMGGKDNNIMQISILALTFLVLQSVPVLSSQDLATSSSGTLELAATPVSMAGFEKISGLKNLELGLWTAWAANNSSVAAEMDLVDVVLACPQIHAL